MIEVGQPAPRFSLPDHDGDQVALEDLLGDPVVVYFYPKDDTPGCTTQACGIRDHWDEFQRAGAVVLGISPDDVDDHRAFRETYDLPHTLLADPEHRVLEAYDAWGEKNLYGRKSIGVIRSTVLVDRDGTVARHWKRAQPKTHADRVLAALAEL